MDDLIREFLLESYENLDRLDQEFVKLETEPGNLELLKSIFRTIHTIKGTCGFLGFSKLEALTHAGENLLSVWARRPSDAELRDHHGIAGHGGCSAADVGQHRHPRRGRTTGRPGIDRHAGAPAPSRGG